MRKREYRRDRCFACGVDLVKGDKVVPVDVYKTYYYPKKRRVVKRLYYHEQCHKNIFPMGKLKEILTPRKRRKKNK